MKIEPKDCIPIIGYRRYIKRYFAAEKRGDKEAVQAAWFEIYHLVVAWAIGITILALLKALMHDQ